MHSVGIAADTVALESVVHDACIVDPVAAGTIQVDALLKIPDIESTDGYIVSTVNVEPAAARCIAALDKNNTVSGSVKV